MARKQKPVSRSGGKKSALGRVSGVVYRDYGPNDRIIWSVSKKSESYYNNPYPEVHRLVWNPVKLTFSYFIGKSELLPERKWKDYKPTFVRKWIYKALVHVGKGEVYAMERGFNNVTYMPRLVHNLFSHLPVSLQPIVSEVLFGHSGSSFHSFEGEVLSDKFSSAYQHSRQFFDEYVEVIFGRNWLDSVASKTLGSDDVTRVRVDFESGIHIVPRTVARANGLREAAKKLFNGNCGKIACKVLSTKTLEDIILLSCYSPVLNWDYMVNFLQGKTSYYGAVPSYFTKKIMKMLPERIVKKGFESHFVRPLTNILDRREMTLHDLFVDALRMIVALPKGYDLGNINDYCDTMRDFHDYIVREYNLSQLEADKEVLNKEFKISGRRLEDLQLLEAHSKNGWSLRFPRKRLDIKLWSMDMHHCIYTYAESFVCGDCILLGLYNGEHLEANIMLQVDQGHGLATYHQGYRVVQFYGKYNAVPTAPQYEAFVSMIRGMTLDFTNVERWAPQPKAVEQQ